MLNQNVACNSRTQYQGITTEGKAVFNEALISTLLAITILFTTLSAPTLAAYPGYPWPANVFPVANNQARHHIVPGGTMMASCLTRFNNQNELFNFLNAIINVDQAIISYPTLQALAQAYYEVPRPAEAEEEVNALCAWLPGNIVIGPKNRPNDPGQVFDVRALNCRISAGEPHLAIYQGFQANWNAGGQNRINLINALRGIAPIAVNEGTAGNGQNCHW